MWRIRLKRWKVIYYYNGCDNPEINSDIEVSISGIVNYVKKNNIRLIELDKQKKCGYLLVCGEKKTQIRSAVTDVDLPRKSRGQF